MYFCHILILFDNFKIFDKILRNWGVVQLAGHKTLDLSIGVRIPAPQFFYFKIFKVSSASALTIYALSH